MGLKTRKVALDPKHREAIEKHAVWAANQEPIVGVLIRYEKNCHLYAALPTTRPEPTKFNYHKIDRIVLVPPIVNETVTIPAEYAAITAGTDRSRHVVLYMEVGKAPDGDRTLGCYVEIGDGCELVLPGGYIAKLVRDSHNDWRVVDPLDPEPSTSDGPAGE